MDELLTGLRAVAEPTRLRLLALCAQGELTVTELPKILGQSQPRVSRHLKLLCEAGLLDRFREGSWVFYRLARAAPAGALAAHLVVACCRPTIRHRCATASGWPRSSASAAEPAAAYFRENAAQWDRIRSLSCRRTRGRGGAGRRPRGPAGRATCSISAPAPAGCSSCSAPKVERAVGIDLSREMLAVARANLERAGLAQLHRAARRHVSAAARRRRRSTLVVIHQVLHYADDPAAAIAEAARVLRPGGRLVVVDFAPHELEFLRDEHAHRRLGFADAEVRGMVPRRRARAAAAASACRAIR